MAKRRLKPQGEKKSALHLAIRKLVRSVYPGLRLLEEEALDVVMGGQRRVLLVDFLLPDIGVVIEGQGRQHDEYVPFFHGHHGGFKDQQQRDAAKASVIRAAGYTLVEIRQSDLPMSRLKLIKLINKAIAERA